jgi:hypothetical protein
MRHTLWLLGGLALMALAAPSVADPIYPLEREIPPLRLGERVMVDDGTCPAGQIKQVTGTKLTASGVLRVEKCIPRLGAKKK